MCDNRQSSLLRIVRKVSGNERDDPIGDCPVLLSLGKFPYPDQLSARDYLDSTHVNV